MSAGTRATAEILAERLRQERLKAEGRFLTTAADDVSNWERLAYVIEEVGEVADAILDHEPVENIRKEISQIAALCQAWLEGLDNHPLSLVRVAPKGSGSETYRTLAVGAAALGIRSRVVNDAWKKK